MVVALHFTHRALEQLSEIRTSSLEKHGKKVAEAYMEKIEDVLNMLSEYHHLLQERPYADCLRFYPAAQHMLVSTMIEQDIYVLAVHHGASDMQGLMARLEGTLLNEAKILHQKACKSVKT